MSMRRWACAAVRRPLSVAGGARLHEATSRRQAPDVVFYQPVIGSVMSNEEEGKLRRKRKRAKRKTERLVERPKGLGSPLPYHEATAGAIVESDNRTAALVAGRSARNETPKTVFIHGLRS
jgi:hypothetical protein